MNSGVSILKFSTFKKMFTCLGVLMVSISDEALELEIVDCKNHWSATEVINL